mmetsp:Transcript_10551/g.16530  ORF Transcript_10551/g.16530 Transcript_10551/m.16530 type:complete len:105 (+) Transcript_10551:1002-1316(+)
MSLCGGIVPENSCCTNGLIRSRQTNWRGQKISGLPQKCLHVNCASSDDWGDSRTLVLHEMNGQTKHSSDSDSEDVSEEIDNCMALVQRMINDCEERERIGLKYL